MQVEIPQREGRNGAGKVRCGIERGFRQKLQRGDFSQTKRKSLSMGAMRLVNASPDRSFWTSREQIYEILGIKCACLDYLASQPSQRAGLPTQ
jgi:hypothetical protein